jgi:hypothetical protein
MYRSGAKERNVTGVNAGFYSVDRYGYAAAVHINHLNSIVKMRMCCHSPKIDSPHLEEFHFLGSQSLIRLVYSVFFHITPKNLLFLL